MDGKQLTATLLPAEAVPNRYDEEAAASFVAKKLQCDVEKAKQAIVAVEKEQLLLRSHEGRQLAAAATHTLLPEISAVYARQKKNTTCGVASLALVLRFLLSQDAAEESSLLARIDSLHSHSLSPVSSESILRSGMSFPQLQTIASALCGEFEIGIEVSRPGCSKDLEELVEAALRGGEVPLCNYHMAVAGQGQWWGGHWAPIVAIEQPYASARPRRVLVLDGWLYTDPFWIDSEQLAKATAGIDASSGEPRGFVVFRTSGRVQ
eukprot:386351-Rhodomonas_salina.1